MKSTYIIEIDNDVERQYNTYIKYHFCSKQNSFVTDVDRYEIICSNCGVVISENLSEFLRYSDIYNIGLNAPGIVALGIIGAHYFKYKALEEEKNNRCN